MIHKLLFSLLSIIVISSCSKNEILAERDEKDNSFPSVFLGYSQYSLYTDSLQHWGLFGFYTRNADIKFSETPLQNFLYNSELNISSELKEIVIPESNVYECKLTGYLPYNGRGIELLQGKGYNIKIPKLLFTVQDSIRNQIDLKYAFLKTTNTKFDNNINLDFRSVMTHINVYVKTSTAIDKNTIIEIDSFKFKNVKCSEIFNLYTGKWDNNNMQRRDYSIKTDTRISSDDKTNPRELTSNNKGEFLFIPQDLNEDMMLFVKYKIIISDPILDKGIFESTDFIEISLPDEGIKWYPNKTISYHVTIPVEKIILGVNIGGWNGVKK